VFFCCSIIVVVLVFDFKCNYFLGEREIRGEEKINRDWRRRGIEKKGMICVFFL